MCVSVRESVLQAQIFFLFPLFSFLIRVILPLWDAHVWNFLLFLFMKWCPPGPLIQFSSPISMHSLEGVLLLSGVLSFSFVHSLCYILFVSLSEPFSQLSLSCLVSLLVLIHLRSFPIHARFYSVYFLCAFPNAPFPLPFSLSVCDSALMWRSRASVELWLPQSPAGSSPTLPAVLCPPAWLWHRTDVPVALGLSLCQHSAPCTQCAIKQAYHPCPLPSAFITIILQAWRVAHSPLSNPPTSQMEGHNYRHFAFHNGQI